MIFNAYYTIMTTIETTIGLIIVIGIGLFLCWTDIKLEKWLEKRLEGRSK